jgi:hypothetical protein
MTGRVSSGSHAGLKWSADGKTFLRYIARAVTFDVAVAAFEAAIKADRHAYITLRHASTEDGRRS